MTDTADASARDLIEAAHNLARLAERPITPALLDSLNAEMDAARAILDRIGDHLRL
jgi:hypothetical protein